MNDDAPRAFPGRQDAKETTQRRMEFNKRWAAGYVREKTRRPPGGGQSAWEATPWKERSVADVASLAVIGMHESEQRANKLANRPQVTLGVVVMPPPAASIEEWERDRKAIEATAAPSPRELPPKTGKP